MAYKKYTFNCEICSKESIVLVAENETTPEYCPHCGGYMLEDEESSQDLEGDLE